MSYVGKLVEEDDMIIAPSTDSFCLLSHFTQALKLMEFSTATEQR